jgi:hypothetical protein
MRDQRVKNNRTHVRIVHEILRDPRQGIAHVIERHDDDDQTAQRVDRGQAMRRSISRCAVRTSSCVESNKGHPKSARVWQVRGGPLFPYRIFIFSVVRVCAKRLQVAQPPGTAAR